MIDRETVERIKSAANIVDVVSEFVTLRRSGSNYKGLCPFHNEKTPSFIVSPARGTCHCFGCGKGGDSVSFIMEHEQMTYPEALRWLAKKYHIEIHERELTDGERQAQSERESMYIVNEWAGKYFQDLLHNDPDGIAIGMQYFRSRGFRDDVIRTFQLGYDLPDRQALAHKALQKGYKEEFLLKTGICYKNDRGELIDRYAGRVVFPWIGVSGKVVGFTARVLDSRTKGVNQKYVNSPDSEIYHKTNELYGIYQAKRAIAKEDRVYMVEGQADVISMYQCGIENVVANSGTALTLPQIHLLHRFTNNITLLYDGDAAGIHAAIRGTDMLLAEGMNLRILLLPDNDDPDSFARKHTAEDFRKYIEENQTDFIQFKTDLLLKNERDPQKRSEAINSIVASIATIPNQTLRDIYLHDCAERIGINEATLINQMNQYIRQQRGLPGQRPDDNPGSRPQPLPPTPQQQQKMQESKVEAMIVREVIKWGDVVIFDNVQDDEGNTFSFNVAQYVHYNLTADDLQMQSPIYNRIIAEANEQSTQDGFKAEPYFVHHPDIDVSRVAMQLTAEHFVLSESQQVKVTPDTIRRNVMHLLLDFRLDIVAQRMKDLKTQIAGAGNDRERLLELMAQFKDCQLIRNQLAKQVGHDVILR
ncbi:MAG: DNA primase [Prevotella sp.]